MREDQTSADDARRIIYGDDTADWPSTDAEDPQGTTERALAEGIALECAALEVGQSREFGYIIGHGRETDAPIVVTRVCGSGGA